MAKYRLYKNNNSKSRSYNKYYARKAAEGMVEVDDVADHMVAHGCAYSKGTIKGVVADLTEHIREMAYEGKSVKIPDLGIFYISMTSNGVTDPKTFNAATDIQSKWHVMPTGEVRTAAVGQTHPGGAVLVWEEATDYQSPRRNTPDDNS